VHNNYRYIIITDTWYKSFRYQEKLTMRLDMLARRLLKL